MDNIDTLVKDGILHHDDKIQWTINYLLQHPKTDLECPDFTQAFNVRYPDEDAIDTLETLYRQGIASKYALREYYINDTSISIIEGRQQMVNFQKKHNLESSNEPIWDF